MKKSLTLLLAISSIPLMGCSASKEASLTGFDIDLARKTANYLGVNVSFQEIVWEQKEIELNAKNIDLIWNGFTITDERKENLSFSLPYMANKQVIIAKKGFTDTIDSKDTYKVAYEQGSAGGDAFSSESIFKNCTPIEVTDQITALTEVKAGTSDLAIIDSVMAGYYLASASSYGDYLTILTSYAFSSESYGIGARKGEDAFISKINEALSALYNDGTTKAIAEAYGLENDLLAPEAFTAYKDIQDTSSWDYIVNKGSIVVGYTIFAPIAFTE